LTAAVFSTAKTHEKVVKMLGKVMLFWSVSIGLKEMLGSPFVEAELAKTSGLANPDSKDPVLAPFPDTKRTPSSKVETTTIITTRTKVLANFSWILLSFTI